MKRNTIMAVLLCITLLLTGCGAAEKPYRVDTVVRIPVDPTEESAAAPEESALPTETDAPAETAATTESTEAAETEEVTEATEEKSGSSGKKTGSGKKPSGQKKPSSGKKSDSDKKQETVEPTKATESAPTEPAPTEPPETQLPETEPPTEPEPTEAPTEPPYDPSDYSMGSLEKAILKQINKYRTEAGLDKLSKSNRLSGIAALRAKECSEVWSHSRPDGRNYTTAMSDYGYGFGNSAELLVSGSGDAEAIVAKWMDSDSGKKILNEDFSTAGIGVYRSGGMTIIACLLVG